jgi:hypothetical protein
MTKLEHYGNAFATLAEAVDVASNTLTAVAQRSDYIRLLTQVDPSPAAEALAKKLASQARRQVRVLQEVHIQIQDLLETLSEAHRDRQGDDNV